MLVQTDIGGALARGKRRLAKSRSLLACYFPLGDPCVAVDLIDLYAGEGVDVIELGLASPDPYLDGRDIRASMMRADRGHWRRDLDAALDRLDRCHARPATLVMTYADSSHPALLDESFWPGIDSLLVVAPPADPLRGRLEAGAQAQGTAISAFVALPVTDQDIAAAKAAEFYVMLQAGEGATGPRDTVDAGSRQRVAALRQAGVTAPILLGFGISSGMQAKAAIELGADGVVVGSQVLRAALGGSANLSRLLGNLRSGLDG